MQFLIHQINASLSAEESEVLRLAKKKMEAVCGRIPMRTASVYKRSVDARHRDRIRFVYSVMIDIDPSPAQIEKLQRAGMEAVCPPDLAMPKGTEPTTAPPVVVGFGPGGMFAALLLAQHGYRPVVLERGADVDTRTAQVDRFCQEGVLDPESNVQFGAGGAGTFSDGKLVTRIHDPYCRYVLQELFHFGAPKEVLTFAKPHIGTDRLRGVVKAIEAKIIALGGEVRYHTKMTDFTRKNGKIIAVQTDRGEQPCSGVILAVGHSARDVYTMLDREGFLLEPKAFSVGVRIEHLQEKIDQALYGDFAGDPRLRHAEYALSHHAVDDRGVKRCVYSFCMCPGGTVMASASEAGGVVTNGMSVYERNGKNANAALAVSVTPGDCADLGLNGMEYQRRLEENAYAAGGRNYRAPGQTVGDFLCGTQGTAPSSVQPTYRDGQVTLCDLHTVLPPYVCRLLELGLQRFDRQIRGFADRSAFLTGVETRTSAPFRILRNKETYTASAAENLYPCGEGAGYAGGITSAAVDGLHCATALMDRYAPYQK